MRFLAAFIVAFLLAGCVHNTVAPLAPMTRDNSSPHVGEIVEAEVGETIVDESHVQIRRGLEFLEPLEFQVEGYHFHFQVPQGASYVETSVINGRPAFCGPGKMDTTLFQQGVYSGNSLCFVLRDGQLLSGGSAKPLNVTGGTQVSFKTKEVVQDRGGLKRHLLYSGRSGNQLMVSYREFKDDMARPAFTQEVSFDLSQGREVGYRGARFEVIEATNTKIRYRLLQPFPDLTE